MNIIASANFNPNTLQAPDLYLVIQPPPSYLSGIPTDVCGVVGTAPWGPVNQPVLLGSPADMGFNFGFITASSLTDPHDLPTDITVAFAQSQSQASLEIQAVRVTDNTDTKATAPINDNEGTPAQGAVASALYSGQMGNQIKMILSPGTKTGYVNVTVIGFTGGYSESFQNLPNSGGAFWTALQNALALGINGNRGPSLLARIAQVGTATTVTSESNGNSPSSGTTVSWTLAHFPVKPGTLSATIASVVSGNITDTDNGNGTGSLAGVGVLSGTITYATGVVALTLDVALGSAEAITSSYKYYAATAVSDESNGNTPASGEAVTWTLSHAPVQPGSLSAQIADVVTGNITDTNNGNGTGALSGTGVTSGTITYATGVISLVLSSPLSVAKAITSSYGYFAANTNPVAVPQTVSLTGGTDGRNVSSAQLLGSNQVQPFTGFYALHALQPQVGVAWIAGLLDSSIYSTLQSFADSESFDLNLTFPLGTSTAAAIAAKQGYGIADYNVTFLKDWLYFFDPVNAIVRAIPPLAPACGRIATLAPAQSPLNKNIFGMVGTERNNPTSGVFLPYSLPEIGQLQAAGITLIANPCPGGSYIGFRTAVNSSANPVTSPIEYTRMTNWLANTFGTFLGAYVGQLQSQQPKDPLRQAVRATLNGYLEQLNTPPAGIQPSIDGYLVTCDLTNNTPTTIAQHFLFAYVQVTYLSSVWYFVVTLQGGTTVVTTGSSLNEALTQQ